MWKCIRIMGWILLAPIVWVVGSMLVCMSPCAYTLELEPVQGLPLSSLSANDVAELNERLLQCEGYYMWYVAPFCGIFYKDDLLAVPTAEGGLELVRFRPALGWLDTESRERLVSQEKARYQVLQEWVAEMRKKGELRS